MRLSENLQRRRKPVNVLATTADFICLSIDSIWLIKDLMAEVGLHTFVRHYKYKTRMEEGPFVVKYVLNGDVKGNTEAEGKPEKVAQGVGVEIKPEKGTNEDVNSKLAEAPAKKVERKEEKRIVMSRSEFQQLRKYKKVNMKEVRIIEDGEEEPKSDRVYRQKKKKYRKADRKGSDESDQQEEKHKEGPIKPREGINRKKKNNTQEKGAIYDEYVPIETIQQSRKAGQKVYFKGRVQFGEGPKFRGRVISQEYDGVILVEGKHRNRVIHDDKVYFTILSEENEKAYCKISYIIPCKRQVVGKVELLGGKKIYILNPINNRIAAMNVIADSVSKSMKKKIQTHYFFAEYAGWPANSEYPECKIIEEFGKFGDIEIQTSSLLKTHGIEDAQYDNQIVKVELKEHFDRIDSQTGEYQIPKEEYSKRQDLRDMRIITIDPLNARDFDDALSVTKEGENYSVGVHIADPSFFLDEGSEIDKQAKKRTTSSYLVHRVLPMLPRILCENLCSLNPGKERLTFTLWILLDKQGRIVQKPTFSRSIIKSKARFTYQQAQKIIQGTLKSQSQIEVGFGCVQSSDFPAIAQDILLLNTISTQLRKRRVQRGSLFFEIPKKVFQLDESSKPVSFQIYQRKQAHFLVEELMILANEQVGEILVRQLQSQALLRRHKYPGPKKILRFQTFMKKINMPLTMSTQARVQDQINEVLAKSNIKQSVKDIVKYEMINLLEAADYFITGETDPSTWIHYALNSPVYTHFTSPIRRYPDILVHRQLAAILEKKNKMAVIPPELIELCNEKRMQAKRVSNGCEKIFMCLYLRDNVVVTKGIIMDVEQWGIKICVPRYDFKGMLRFKQLEKLNILEATVDPHGRSVLKIEYKGQVSMKFILKEMQEIEIRLSCKEGFPLDYKLNLLMPCPQRPGQHIMIE